jgi:hypothetical protein
MNAAAISAPSDVVRVFVSYSHKDKRWLDAKSQFNLVPFLADSLRRQNVEFWFDPQLVIGDQYRSLIEHEIDRAQIALLIVSQPFLNSRFIIDEVELPRIAERARRGEMLIAPVLVEPCGWHDYPVIAEQHMVPAEYPLIDYTENEAKWAKVRFEILENLKTQVNRIRMSMPAVKTAPQASTKPAAVSVARASVAAAATSAYASGSATAVAEPEAAENSSASIAEAVKGVRKAGKTMRVALLYKRNAQPDDHVLALLEAALRAAGHEVFIDRHLRIGVEWASEIKRQVQESDAIIPLLSAASVKSEMLAGELEEASQNAQENSGKPRILPVRVRFEEGLTPDERALPEPFFGILGRLQYQPWESEADDRELIARVLDALIAREQSTIVPEQEPGGADPLDSPYYVERPTDLKFREAVDRQDSIVSVKGARQMGKTSLLARGMQYARERGKKVVFFDLQKSQSSLTSAESLYKAICETAAAQLDLDVFPDDVWRPNLPPGENFDRYLRKQVLGKTEGHLILALDEVDLLTGRAHASEVFGQFRSWHSDRAMDPTGPWKRLTLAIVYATEAYMLITDQNQSPFNVGTQLRLHDFSLSQVQELNHRYQDPLKNGDELNRFYALFSGQPYLTRRGFFDLTAEKKSLTELEAKADADDGPYGDHLKRILFRLTGNDALKNALRGLLKGEPLPDAMTFHRLSGAGLVVGESTKDAHFRCAIYQRFLARHLG